MTVQHKNDPRIDELLKEFRAFKEQYDMDMRGDKDLSNGNKGVIGEIRELKNTLKTYPSITWLFAHHPVATISAGLGIYVFLTTLYTMGMLKIFGDMVGLNLP